MEDQLSQLRELFYIGSYDSVISHNLKLSNDLSQAEYNLLRLRSKLSLGQFTPSEVNSILESDTSSFGERAVACTARYMSAKDATARRAALDSLCALHSAAPGDATVRSMLACCFVTETEITGDDRMMDAVSLLDEGGPLEIAALRTQVLIMADRSDLANQLQNSMVSTYEEAPVTKLASSWCSMVNGNFQECYLTFGDLDSYLSSQDIAKMSPVLLNGKAVANMHRQLWPEALEDLEAANAEVKEGAGGGNRCCNDIGCAEAVTLANLVALYNNIRNYNAAEDAYKKLAERYPLHPMVTKTESADSIFDAFQKSVGLASPLSSG